MELTQSQISEILLNYTSSSEGFVIILSLIMNSLIFRERELFVSGNANEQCNGFRPRRTSGAREYCLYSHSLCCTLLLRGIHQATDH